MRMRAAAVTLLAGAAGRALGALYRLALAPLAGAEGLALYQYAFPGYALAVTLLTAGLVQAAARERARGRAVLGPGLRWVLGLGLPGAVLLAVLSPWTAALSGDGEAAWAAAALAGALPFAGITALARGCLLGSGRLGPLAASQLVEQGARLLLGLGMASLLRSRGPLGAAVGAALGTVGAEAVTAAVLLAMTRGSEGGESRGVLRALAGQCLPMAAGAALMPLAGMAEGALITGNLRAMGLEEGERRALYGLWTGPVQTLLHLPGVMFSALVTTVTPALQGKGAGRALRRALMAALAGGAAAGLVLGWLAGPVMGLLCPGYAPHHRGRAASQLAVAAGSLPFAGVMQVLCGALQARGRGRQAAAVLALSASVRALAAALGCPPEAAAVLASALGAATAAGMHRACRRG